MKPCPHDSPGCGDVIETRTVMLGGKPRTITHHAICAPCEADLAKFEEELDRLLDGMCHCCTGDGCLCCNGTGRREGPPPPVGRVWKDELLEA